MKRVRIVEIGKESSWYDERKLFERKIMLLEQKGGMCPLFRFPSDNHPSLKAREYKNEAGFAIGWVTYKEMDTGKVVGVIHPHCGSCQ